MKISLSLVAMIGWLTHFSLDTNAYMVIERLLYFVVYASVLSFTFFALVYIIEVSIVNWKSIYEKGKNLKEKVVEHYFQVRA